MRPPVVLLHGAFCGGWAMQNIAGAFEAGGYATIIPDLRHHHDGPFDGRDLGALAVTSTRDYVRDLQLLICALPERPIVVGHSMGGLLAQMLAAKGLARAIVLLAPSAPWGLLPSHWEEYASAFGLYLTIGDYWRRAIAPAYEIAAERALDRLTPQDRDEAFARFVPESGRAVFEILNWWLDASRATDVPLGAVDCPVFCAAGALDRVNPVSTVRRVAARYRENAAYKEYERMSHWLIGEPGWEEIASDTVAWADTIIS